MTEAIVKDFLTSFRDRDSDCLQGGSLGEVLVGVMGLLIGFEVLSASVVLAVEFRRGGMV